MDKQAGLIVEQIRNNCFDTRFNTKNIAEQTIEEYARLIQLTESLIATEYRNRGVRFLPAQVMRPIFAAAGL